MLLKQNLSGSEVANSNTETVVNLIFRLMGLVNSSVLPFSGSATTFPASAKQPPKSYPKGDNFEF